ncbi:hypothetical protein FB451DRAFT_1398178 [Mycena latifolia]|nr:hypothetical protein FB451DRAFT_1398178 [Mycena latifolia]
MPMTRQREAKSELDPGLRFETIADLSRHMRKIATEAAYGSLDGLRHLQRNVLDRPQAETYLYLPAFYANLDPTRIPRPAELDLPEDPISSIMARAYISLLALRDYETLQVNVLPQLWPRCWAWIRFFDVYPPADTAGEGEDRWTYFWIVDRFYSNPATAHVVDLSAGVRVLVAQVWKMLLHRIDVLGDTTGMQQFCTLLRGREKPDFHAPPAQEPHQITHIEELIEGAGGTWNDFVSLVVNTISISSSRTDTRGLFAIVLIFLQDAEFRGLLCSPELLVSAGVMDAIASGVCVANANGAHGFGSILDIAFYLFGAWMYSDLGLLVAALKSGLIRAIVSCSANYLDMRQARGILRELPGCTIHYYVLRHMRRSLREIEHVVASASFRASPMFDDWNDFMELVAERGAIQDLLDSGAYTLSRACDNLECGAVLEHAAFRRRPSERMRSQVPVQKVTAYVGRLRNRDQNFIRAVLHTDYLASKQAILLAQVEFLAAQPNRPFYIGFDYTAGHPSIELHALEPFDGPWGVPNDQCNAEQVARAQRSGGRVALHRVFCTTVGIAHMRWFPLRSTSGVLGESVRHLARESEGAANFDELRPGLMERIAALDVETSRDLVELH